MSSDKNLPKIDKLYNFILKRTSDSIATALTNQVFSTSFIVCILTHLKIENIKIAKLLILAAKEINYFGRFLSENIQAILMACLHSEESMNLALDIEEYFAKTNRNYSLTAEMQFCLYWHTLLYPSNHKRIMDILRPRVSVDLVINYAITIARDEVDLVEKVFEKKNDIRFHIFKYGVFNDAEKICNRANRYYNIKNNHVFLAFSLPGLLDNLHKIDTDSSDFIEDLLQECNMHCRWDLIPFILDSYNLSDKQWDHFRMSLYYGYMNLPFFQALIHNMKIKNIPIETLIHPKHNTIVCNKDLQKELVKFGCFENIKITELKTFPWTETSQGICNLFQEFREMKLEKIVIHLMFNMAHKSNRFVKEITYIDDMRKAGFLGWSEQVNNSFELFVKFFNRIKEELVILDKVVMEYNSLLAVQESITPMLEIRLVNSIRNKVKTISCKFIINQLDLIIGNVNYFHHRSWKNIASTFKIDINEDWVLPENPTLEELFMDKYLNTEYKRIDYESEEICDLINGLYAIKFIKIAAEVENAIASFVPVGEIKDALMKRKIFI